MRQVAGGPEGPSATAPVLARVLVVALLFASWTLPGRAEAHAEYARSIPAADARIPRAPERLDVWFTQELFRRTGANSLEVYAADGNRVDDGAPVLDDADRTHLSVGLTANLEAGAYRVVWRSLSAIDGDTAEGELSFVVDPSAAEPIAVPADAEGAATPASGGVAGRRSYAASVPWWTVVAALAIAVSGVLGVWALRPPAAGGERG